MYKQHRPRSHYLRMSARKVAAADLGGLLHQRALSILRLIDGRDYRPRRIEKVVVKVMNELIRRNDPGVNWEDEVAEWWFMWPGIGALDRHQMRPIALTAIAQLDAWAERAEEAFTDARVRAKERLLEARSAPGYEEMKAAQEQAAKEMSRRKGLEKHLAEGRAREHKKALREGCSERAACARVAEWQAAELVKIAERQKATALEKKRSARKSR